MLVTRAQAKTTLKPQVYTRRQLPAPKGLQRVTPQGYLTLQGAGDLMNASYTPLEKDVCVCVSTTIFCLYFPISTQSSPHHHA